MTKRQRESVYEAAVRLRVAAEAGKAMTVSALARSAGEGRVTTTRLLQLAQLPGELVAALGGASAIPLVNGAKLGRALQQNPARLKYVIGHAQEGRATGRSKPDWAGLIALAEGASFSEEQTRQTLSGRGQRAVGGVGGAARSDGRLLIELRPNCPVRVKERLLAVLSEEFPGWSSPVATTAKRSTWDIKRKKPL